LISLPYKEKRTGKFSQESAKRLLDVATNGPRCGVFTIVLLDKEQQLPYDFNLDDLRRVSAVDARSLTLLLKLIQNSRSALMRTVLVM
jgi:hypothetical protein